MIATVPCLGDVGIVNPTNKFKFQMKNILMVSAAAWLLTIALALVSLPPKSAGNEPLKCLVHKGDTLRSKQAEKSPPCKAYVGSDATPDELDPANELKR